jgi:hypothetical protein
MHMTKLGLLAAASALALPSIAPPATAAPVAPARTFAQLLEPIPNAVDRLKASDNELTVRHYLMPAQRHRYRRWYHGRWIYSWGPWIAPPVYYGYPYRYYHHHHHHHHHHHNHF